MNAEIMKTGTNQVEDGGHYSGSSDNVIPLSLRSPDTLSPSVEQSIPGQSPHHNEVVHPAADPAPSPRIRSPTPAMSAESLRAMSGEAVQDSSARPAATAGLDESKRRERNTGEAEAAGLHPVPLSA